MITLKLWWKQSSCNHDYTDYSFSANYSKSSIEKELLICTKCDKKKPIKWFGFYKGNKKLWN